MSTVNTLTRARHNIGRWLWQLLIWLLITWGSGEHGVLAHPLTQGAMEMRISRSQIDLEVRVTVEQVFLTAALSAPAGDPDVDVWKRHGDYLRQHLQLFVDGRPLSGHLVQFPIAEQMAGTNAAAVAPLVVYRFRYDLTANGAPESEVRLAQDVLADIQSVPGQPWEATFVVRITQNRREPVEGLLLTAKQPINYRCDWRESSGSSSSGTGHVARWRMATEYLRHGVAHILTGWDHLLFVAALVLAVTTFWDLVKVVTAFTLAHTITLTLAVLDVVRLPGSVVEPFIAGSIVIVALQNIFWPRHSRGPGRLAIAFFFGLFHGLGFAGGLMNAMAGLSGGLIVLAIAAFSAGVELGHQVVVLPVFSLLRLARRHDTAASAAGGRLLQLSSVPILLAGLFYLFAALA